uniref:Putative secreted protein n=1 Tax=Anopheles darlingi TaxID=43151 RepID=A0A2M4DRN1_ANODA
MSSVRLGFSCFLPSRRSMLLILSSCLKADYHQGRALVLNISTTDSTRVSMTMMNDDAEHGKLFPAPLDRLL